MRRLTAGVGLDRDGSEGRLFSEVYDLASEIQRPPAATSSAPRGRTPPLQADSPLERLESFHRQRLRCLVQPLRRVLRLSGQLLYSPVV